MALETQAIPFPFAAGEDTKTDPLQVDPPRLLVAKDGFFQSPKSFRKRYGYSALASQLTAGKFSATYGNGLVVGDGKSLYSYGANPPYAFWNKGAMVPMKLTTSLVNADYSDPSQANQSHQDCAYDAATDQTCYIWFTAGAPNDIDCTVVNQTTGQKNTVSFSLIIANIVLAKVFAFQNYFVFIYGTSAGTLLYRTMSTTLVGTVSAPVTLASDFSTSNPTLDATLANGRIYVAYNKSTTGFSAFYIDSSFVVSTKKTDTTHAANGAISISSSFSNNIFIYYSTNTDVYGVAYDSNLSATVYALTQVSGADNVNQITSASYSTSGVSSIVFFCAYTNHSTTNLVYISTITNGGAPASVLPLQYSVSLGSKVFGTYSGGYYFVGRYGGTTSQQPTNFVFYYAPTSGPYSYVVGKFEPSTAYDISLGVTLPEVVAPSSGVYLTTYSKAVGVNEFAAFAATAAVQMDFNARPQTAELANNLHLTGGQLWMWDGESVCEHGFHLYPDNMSYVLTGSGANLQASSTYSYVAVYEWIDAQGQLHRSAPSAPLTVTTSSPGPTSVSVTVSNLRVTNKFTNTAVQILLYRTTANGTIYFYCSSAGPNASTPFADTTTIVDSQTDTSIQGQVELYTTSGEVENSSAPACDALCTYRSRLIVIPSDNPNSWWFSKEVLPASASTEATPVELSEFFIKNIDQVGGGVTNCLAMDDKLILTKSGAVGFYYVVGNGPSVNGQNDDYTTPQSVVTDMGVLAGTPMVLMPDGIMFQSAKGIGLLDRSLSTKYIGAPVENVLGSGTITSSVLVPSQNQVRFSISGGTSSGSAVVYDYLVNEWLTYSNHPAVDACLFQSLYTFIKSDGSVYQENKSVFTDNGTNVSRTVTTPWIHLAGINGFQRVWQLQLLGTYESASSLTVSIAYDYDSTIVQTDVITLSSANSLRYRVNLARQKCEALQITITDTSGAGEGSRWSGITLLAGVKKGSAKLPATQVYG